MQETIVTRSDLPELDRALSRAQSRLPELKREVLAELGEELLAQVRANIGGTGKVQRWQHTHLGSGGGYVSVHAVEKQTDRYGYAVGAVTNAVESGHRVPGPSGKNERYRPRVRKTRVPGKGMYAGLDAEHTAQASVTRLEAELAQLLEEG